MSYVPALKAREAEIKALMRAPAKLEVTPLFDLQVASAGSKDENGDPKRAKGTRTDAAYFLDDIARLWSGPLYVDISRIATASNRAKWWKLLDALNALASVPAELIPVLVPDDSADIHAAAAGVAAVTGRAALRIPMTSAIAHPGSLAGVTNAIAKNMNLKVSDIDVILDWADGLEKYKLDHLVKATQAVITAINGDHGELVTIGTPNSDAFQQEGDWNVARREWWLWRRLADEGIDVVYGDYALYPPSDPVPVSPKYGHLRYSNADRMHVHRRAIPATGGGLAAAFGDCCTHLVSQPHWMSPGFSRADQRIHDIANKADKESQAGAWRQIAAEHHFKLITELLKSPPPAPPAGTT